VNTVFHHFLHQIHIVIQRVDGVTWMEDVTCVANGRFTYSARLQNGFNADFEIFEIVQTVKNSKNINSLRAEEENVLSLKNETEETVVGIEEKKKEGREKKQRTCSFASLTNS
jgi:hypothetical protein